MRLIIESTSTLAIEQGVPMRVWDARTERGTKLHAFVAFLIGPEEGTPVPPEDAAELATLEDCRPSDLALVVEPGSIPAVQLLVDLVRRLQAQVQWRNTLASFALEELDGWDEACTVDELVTATRLGAVRMRALTEDCCGICGCTQSSACESEDGPCGWARSDLCTACVDVERTLEMADTDETDVDDKAAADDAKRSPARSS